MRQERTATRPPELLKSIDVEIVPGCNFAFIDLANFFQHLLSVEDYGARNPIDQTGLRPGRSACRTIPLFAITFVALPIIIL